jgi:hypothetical protein
MAPVSIGSTNKPAGILLADIWKELVLQLFSAMLDLDQPHRPILAASEGFSRATTSQTPQLYLDDSQPMFFPAGKLISTVVEVENGGPTYRAFYLLETCSPPLGFCWPTTLSVEDFFESLRLLGRPYKPFLQTMEAIQSDLEDWFATVQAHPQLFAIPVCTYSLLAPTAFPALIDGTYPPTILDPRGFSPLLDMRYGLVWQLHCDQVLTVTTGWALQHYSTFLH